MMNLYMNLIDEDIEHERPLFASAVIVSELKYVGDYIKNYTKGFQSKGISFICLKEWHFRTLRDIEIQRMIARWEFIIIEVSSESEKGETWGHWLHCSNFLVIAPEAIIKRIEINNNYKFEYILDVNV